MARRSKNSARLAITPEQLKVPDFGLFVGIVSLAAAFLIPLLQANGVDVNWWTSLTLYAFLIAICAWSFLFHAVPHKGEAVRVTGETVLVVAIGLWLHTLSLSNIAG